MDLAFLVDIIKDIQETDNKKNLVKNNIDILFDKLNFDSCLKGTDMLKNAVFIALYNSKYVNNLDDLFHELSQTYSDIKPKTIRTNIDNAITTMFNFNGRNPKFFCTFFQIILDLNQQQSIL